MDEALRNRFGVDAVFRDGRSIRPGSEYPHELLTQLRRSRAVLVVIGPGWAAAPGLRREDDWVRREITEAHACRIPIIPILGGANVAWLRKDELPSALSWLSEYQSLRYVPYDSSTDLVRIGDELALLIPELTDQRRQNPSSAPEAGPGNSVSGGDQGTLVQGRDFSGDIAGAIYKNNTGPFHTGSGDQHTHHHTGSLRFTGDEDRRR
ncbi:hypothetical protein ADK57_07585 [Streptomyces sp. MMG1533]|nr:hypothetical protein ADK57_07585 [Streptomyces sp. MMG1533]